MVLMTLMLWLLSLCPLILDLCSLSSKRVLLGLLQSLVVELALKTKRRTEAAPGLCRSVSSPVGLCLRILSTLTPLPLCPGPRILCRMTCPLQRSRLTFWRGLCATSTSTCTCLWRENTCAPTPGAWRLCFC